jgi:hypothetical protein
VARPFSKQRDSGRLHAKTERGRWPEEVTVVLEDKVVLVTGVAKGCGRVLAEAFAAEGAKLVGCDIDVDGGRATSATVRSAGGEMTFVEADVADETAVTDLVATAVRTYGGLDCAVNNAGTEATGPIADAADAVFTSSSPPISGVCCSASSTRSLRCAPGAGDRSSTCPR